MPRRPPLWKDMTRYDVEIAGRPGELARLTRLLGKASIQLDSVVSSDGGRTVLSFLAYRDERLRRKLDRAGARVSESQVFELELPNGRWELHRLARALADKGISVLSLRSAVDGERLRMVLAVDDPANAVALAARLGFEPDYAVRESP